MEELEQYLCAMKVSFDESRVAITSLCSPDDEGNTEFLLTPEEFPQYDIKDSKWLGHIYGKTLIAGEERYFSTGLLKETAQISYMGKTIQACYSEIVDNNGDSLGFALKSEMDFSRDTLDWKITLDNQSDRTLIFTEIDIPLLMDQYFRKDDYYKYEQCVMRHTCVVGASSYAYWEKSSGNGPVLLMAAVEGTVLEAFRKERLKEFRAVDDVPGAFEGLFSLCPVGAGIETAHGQTSILSLEVGEKKCFSFRFGFLLDESKINQALTDWGLLAIEAIPGMVLPITEKARVISRCRDKDLRVEPANKEDKALVQTQEAGISIVEISFGDYGIRDIAFQYGSNQTVYSFFVTEPIADIIDKHARFITEKHQETDESDPCHSAFLMWDMVNKRRINSGYNPYFEDWWRGGSDDTGLVSGLFLSEKNVSRPVEQELHALNRYVDDFIVKRLTEQPGFRVHRMVPWYTMFEPWAGYGADDVWRAYNYVHVVNTLFNMYRIQDIYDYPFLKNKRYYLKLAADYSMSMFSYWMYPDGVGATEYGNMGEMTMPLYLDESLRKEGFEKEAAWIGGSFDKKATYFASREYPFGSEMAYDSTAYEAVYGYGKRIGNMHVMEAAAKASFSNRGKQPVWYLYNTDLRGGGDSSWNVSYMTQLGSYPIWDYGINLGKGGLDWLMSYYGAYLSGWLVYNSGGYWSSEKENEGATGWIIVGAAGHTTGQPIDRGFPLMNGMVALSGEAELGFFGALRVASSVLYDHPVLGLSGLGCMVQTKLQDAREVVTIYPDDGLSIRFFNLCGKWRLDLNRDSLGSIVIDGNKLRVLVMNYTRDVHNTTLRLTKLDAQEFREYSLMLEGGDREFEFRLS